jgi:periplasmic copper chaperone A
MPPARPARLLARRRRSASILGGALLGLAALPFLATAASAHVAVTSSDAVRGGEAGLLTFRVPNESATAGTVKVTIDLPTDALAGFVDTQPMPGWVVTTTERSLSKATKVGDFTLDKVTDSVTWTAGPGVAVAPNQFQLFQILLGPLPDAPTMTFKAVQYYDDGSVVTWDQPTPASGAEPANPSPELTLVAAPDPAEGSASSDGTARALGAGGLAVGAIGLGLGALGLSRRRPSAGNQVPRA